MWEPASLSFQPARHVEVPGGDLLSWTFAKYGEYDEQKPIYVDASEPSRSISPCQARRAVRQLVAGFKAHGLEEGDCVCLNIYNDITYPILWLGAIAAGGSVAGSNPSCSASELHHFLKVTKAKFIITQIECIPVVSTVAKGIDFPPSRIFVSAPLEQRIPDGYASLANLFCLGEENWRTFDNEEAAADTIAALNLTSGTTGLPKAAAHSHKSLLAQAVMYFDEEAPKPYEVSQLICLPFFHAFAGPLALIAPLRLGHTTYVMRRFDLQPFLSAIQTFSITETLVVPPIVVTLMKSGTDLKLWLDSLRYIRCAGTTLNPAIQEAFCKLISPECVVAQVWGLTEVGWITRFAWSEQDRTGSVGKQLPSAEIRIVDTEGRVVGKNGEKGEARIRSPATFSGYLDNPAANENAFDSEGWFKTGDLASCNGGKLFLEGRIKDILKVRGFQVSPAELEAILLDHPRVEDCCVVGVSHESPPNWDELLPRAYVKLNPVSKPADDCNPRDSAVASMVGEPDAESLEKVQTPSSSLEGFVQKQRDKFLEEPGTYPADDPRASSEDLAPEHPNHLTIDPQPIDPTAKVTEQDLIDYVASKVSRYKRLAGGVQFVDQLPRTPAGKLIKRALPIPEGSYISIYQ